MTDTSTKAVDIAEMVKDLSHTGDLSMLYRCVIADRLNALSAQLEAANQRHAAAIEAVARARDDALVEAAKLALGLDAKYMRSKYKIEYNRKRYDVSGVERCENKAANVISEDIHNAILALIPADTPAAKVTVQEAAKVLLDALDAHNFDVVVGACFGDEAASRVMQDSRPKVFARAMLTATINYLDPSLDYLRAGAGGRDE